jgi:hypothetical protein
MVACATIPTIVGDRVSSPQALIVLPQPEGHVAVTQQEHARMCGALARAWGSPRFGDVDPEAVLAAEQHELGMLEWDQMPSLDTATGLPTTVRRMDPAVHLPLRLKGPERLRAGSPYAALLASLHHISFYEHPPLYGLLRRSGRQIRSYLDRSASLQRELRRTLAVPDGEIDRNWRLVRAWDGLSHILMYGRAPTALRGVPAANGEQVEIAVTPTDDAVTLDPWPFSSARLRVSVEGALLERSFTSEEEMHDALRAAPRTVLSYELVAV